MTPAITQLKGLHIIGEIYSEDEGAMCGADSFRDFIGELIVRHNLNKVGEVFYQFPGSGFTAVVCLTESHISIHTWPEFNYITCDIYLCNFRGRNNEKCEDIWEKVKEYFRGEEIKASRITR